jgi:uncharacterized protein
MSIIFKRDIQKQIDAYIKQKHNKILFIWGPRRSGKTTLLTSLANRHKARIFNFDSLSDREKFAPDINVLKQITASEPIILIDEVQNAPEATMALKIIHDQLKTKVIATGSSELKQKANQEFDTLTGRYEEIFCLPLTYKEITKHREFPEYEKKNVYTNLLEKFLVFGNYPEIYALETNKNQKIDVLENILNTYVIKDVVNIYQLKNAKLAKDILTQVALQIGHEVSTREIANNLQTNPTTISNYLEIFIKNYILIPLPSFKSNLRRAVSKNRKLYFFDLGIRNALVKDFREINLRPDRGGLFENFIVSELYKKQLVFNLKQSMYFYREYSGKEVDIVIEDYYKKYVCFEIKYSPSEKIKRVFPIPHNLQKVHRSNYWEKI